METQPANSLIVNHVLFISRVFSNAWLKKCSCGEVFTGKGQSDPIKADMHVLVANAEAGN